MIIVPLTFKVLLVINSLHHLLGKNLAPEDRPKTHRCMIYEGVLSLYGYSVPLSSRGLFSSQPLWYNRYSSAEQGGAYGSQRNAACLK